MELVAEGLQSPEGRPIWLDDGSLLLIELQRGTLTQVFPDGHRRAVAHLGGGGDPHASAVGPNGEVYLTRHCRGCLQEQDEGPSEVQEHRTGTIERVDVQTGEVATLYSSAVARDGGVVCLRGPSDLVFDSSGGFWFTDHGWTRCGDAYKGGVYYARTDGSLCKEAVFPMLTPNGIALSPDETILYVAEALTGRLWSFDLDSPGALLYPEPQLAALLWAAPGNHQLDSLAVDMEGHICVVTVGVGPLGQSGIAVVKPNGDGLHSFVPTGDALTTNIAFGGDDHQDAFITLSGAGQLVKVRWHCPGQRCHFEDRLISRGLWACSERSRL